MSTTSPSLSSVDAELAPYRALNSLAVLSFVLGLASILSVPWWFFLCTIPPAAIVTGLLALRQIAGAPQEYAGKRLAQAGVVMGIGFAAVAIGHDKLTAARLSKHGRLFAERFVQKIKAGQLEDAFWLTMPREQRTEIAKQGMSSIPNEFHQRYQQFRMEAKETSELLAKGAESEFVSVERTGREQGVEYAAVVFRVHGGDSTTHAGHGHGEHDDHYVMVLAASYSLPPPGGATWFVRQQNFAYKPNSYEPTRPGGHGHSH